MSSLSLVRGVALCACAVTLSLFASCNKADSGDSSAKPAANAGQPAPTASAPPAASAPAMAGMPGAPAGASLVMASFNVQGMECADCSAAITQSLSKIDGVKSVEAQWQKGLVQVNYEPAKVQPDKLKGAIEALKYKVTGCSVPGAMANCPACPAGAMAGAGAAPAADPASYILASVKQPDGKLAATYQLSGMHCTDCEQKVKTALSAVQGVSGVQATFKDNKVVVTYDPGQATPATLLAALQGTGFGVLAADGKAAPALGGCPAGGQCPCMDKDGCKDDAGQDGKAKSGGPDKGGAKDAKKGTTA